MKRALSLLMAAMFSVAVVGCRASAELEDDDRDGSHSSYKKTTKYDDGEKTTKVETKTTR